MCEKNLYKVKVNIEFAAREIEMFTVACNIPTAKDNVETTLNYILPSYKFEIDYAVLVKEGI